MPKKMKRAILTLKALGDTSEPEDVSDRLAKHVKTEPADIKSMPNKPGQRLVRNKTSPFLMAILEPKETTYQPVSATKQDIAKRRYLFKRYPQFLRTRKGNNKP